MMNLGEIIINSFKYPARDFKKFLLICLLFALPIIPVFAFITIGDYFEILAVLFLLLAVIDILIIPGYFISVVGKGCNQSESVPPIKLGRNIINTFKFAILEFIYGLVPFFVFIIGIFASAYFSFSQTTFDVLLDSISNFITSFLIVLIITILVSFIFSLLSCVATARFAHFNKLRAAFKNIIGDIKEIGVLKLLLWFIVMGIVTSLITIISVLLIFIPYAGIVICLAVLIPYLMMVYYYSLGLLYSNVGGADDDFDLDEFEKEIQVIKMMY